MRSQQNAAEARSQLAEAQRAENTARSAVAGASTDGAIEELIKKRLAADRRLGSIGFDISVSRGVASIAGTVPSADSLQRAAGIAKDVPGVIRVENAIEIAPPIVER
ncbi:MAG: osmotically-inducible protein OsmY [Hyphomicrobiaceae bacterium]